MKFEVSRDGHQVDFRNQAGYWVKRVNGKLMLMSTGAPLSQEERIAFCERASVVLGETVWAS